MGTGRERIACRSRPRLPRPLSSLTAGTRGCAHRVHTGFQLRLEPQASRVLTVANNKRRGGHHDRRRHSRARRHARHRRAEGPVRLRHRLCDGRLRPVDPRLHAARHLGGPRADPGAGRLAHHHDAGRRGGRRHPVRHPQRLLRPGPGADLDDPLVRGVHRPVRLRPGLLGPPGVPHDRRPRPRRRVRHRHGARCRGLAGQACCARRSSRRRCSRRSAGAACSSSGSSPA